MAYHSILSHFQHCKPQQTSKAAAVEISVVDKSCTCVDERTSNNAAAMCSGWLTTQPASLWTYCPARQAGASDMHHSSVTALDSDTKMTGDMTRKTP